ncbi:MAG: molybdate ABC transporter substrate-binding protein [Microbacteriaceae bacterium]
MRPARRRILAFCAGMLVVALSAGCTAASSRVSSASPAAAGIKTGLQGELTIFAAASLTASFDRLAAEFVRQNPAVTIKSIDYDGSSTLVTQLKEGASADVFASADQATMKRLADAGLLSGTSSVFTSNILEMVVPPGNPKRIATLADLSSRTLQVVLCAPQVPCGAAAQSLLALARVKVTPVSEEQNVTAVVIKVATGNADAGLVYRTDVKAAGTRVTGVPIADAGRVVNDYTIGIPSSSKNPKAAAAFIRWVLSPAGQAILAGYGFGKP